MSKGSGGPEKTDKSTELLKIQVYSDFSHTKATIMFSFAFAFFIGFSVLFYTLFYDKVLSPEVWGGSLIIIIAFTVYALYVIIRDYNTNLKRISDMIEIVREGKELPKLEKLRKIGESDCVSTGKKQGEEKPTEASLIAEYKALNDAVNRRSSEMLISDSFLFPISLAVVTFAIIHREELGTNIFFDVSFAVFLPILSSVLVLIFYYFWLTTTRINDICFDRLHEIEKELCIGGHSHIRKRISGKTWWKVRRNMWHIVFWLFIGAYVVTAIWLLGETYDTPTLVSGFLFPKIGLLC